MRSPDGSQEWGDLLARQMCAHSRLFFKIAHSIVRNAAEAEDACQAALAKAWECRDSIRDAASLKGWLVRAITNEALQVVRHQQTAQRLLQRKAWKAEPAPPVHEMLESREIVGKALDRLPEQTREIVVLRAMQGLSGNEVAVLLGCSASEVSRRFHEGMERLREMLTEQPVSKEGTGYGV